MGLREVDLKEFGDWFGGVREEAGMVLSFQD